MKLVLSSLSLLLSAGVAAAHEGHIAPLSGHAHGEILAIVGIAAIALVAYFANRRA